MTENPDKGEIIPIGPELKAKSVFAERTLRLFGGGLIAIGLIRGIGFMDWDIGTWICLGMGISLLGLANSNREERWGESNRLTEKNLSQR
jgi:hypothetical protein